MADGKKQRSARLTGFKNYILWSCGSSQRLGPKRARSLSAQFQSISEFRSDSYNSSTSQAQTFYHSHKKRARSVLTHVKPASNKESLNSSQEDILLPSMFVILNKQLFSMFVLIVLNVVLIFSDSLAKIGPGDEQRSENENLPISDEQLLQILEDPDENYDDDIFDADFIENMNHSDNDSDTSIVSEDELVLLEILRKIKNGQITIDRLEELILKEIL
ncbi:unnamed protein product [Parnassius apollo]|uniref:(apollo) hypothetical protein n=1 Tax=Parnassius apollo TaxID=110799 RepID=A0A8S3W1T4_PARAO|nr:unnamed protein product [Parnassius apollo]